MADTEMVYQPDESGMCGQAVVAMAAGVSLDAATNAVGVSVMRTVGTHYTDLVRGLRRLGVKVGRYVDYTYRKKALVRVPNFAILSIVDGSAWGHWVLVKDGVVYDPGIGWPLPFWVYETMVVERAYSRRFRAKGHKHKNVRAYWGEVIPIVSRPARKLGAQDALRARPEPVEVGG